jgi:hypothetical protein
MSSIRRRNVIACLLTTLAAPPLLARAAAARRADRVPRLHLRRVDPALDWRAAGTCDADRPAIHQRADDGRDWATTQAVQDEPHDHAAAVVVAGGRERHAPQPQPPRRAIPVVGSAFAFVARRPQEGADGQGVGVARAVLAPSALSYGAL